MRSGRREEALRIVRALFEACLHFGWSLPEVFAGFDRDDTPFPIAYPTAARPQAWAAGTPLLLLRLLLGLEPDPVDRRLTVAGAGLPEWAGSLSLTGIPAFGCRWNVHAEADGIPALEAIPQDAVFRVTRRLKERDVPVDDQLAAARCGCGRRTLTRSRRGRGANQSTNSNGQQQVETGISHESSSALRLTSGAA